MAFLTSNRFFGVGEDNVRPALCEHADSEPTDVGRTILPLWQDDFESLYPFPQEKELTAICEVARAACIALLAVSLVRHCRMSQQ